MAARPAAFQQEPPRTATGFRDFASIPRNCRSASGSGCATPTGTRGRSGTSAETFCISSDSAITNRTGSAGVGDVDRVRDYLGNALGVIDLGDPLRQRGEHLAVVDLLKGITPGILVRI